MDGMLFLRGAAIGVALAAPLGPVGLFCIRRALTHGRRAAFLAGLGAAFSDAFYSAVAAFGLSTVAALLQEYSLEIRLASGILLIAIGISALFVRPKEAKARSGPSRPLADMAQTFAIAISNPGNVIAAMALFAALGATRVKNVPTAAVLVLGVLAGSTLWWFILSRLAGLARGRMTGDWPARLSHFAAGFLLLLGTGVLLSLAIR